MSLFPSWWGRTEPANVGGRKICRAMLCFLWTPAHLPDVLSSILEPCRDHATSIGGLSGVLAGLYRGGECGAQSFGLMPQADETSPFSLIPGIHLASSRSRGLCRILFAGRFEMAVMMRWTVSLACLQRCFEFSYRCLRANIVGGTTILRLVPLGVKCAMR